MTNTILTENLPKVNHTFVKASDGSILVGASPLEVLTWMARTHADRIKGFSTFSGNAVKFMGAVVKEVEVSTGDYEQFVSHLKESGWQLRPAVTSGGFTAVLETPAVEPQARGN